MMGVSVPPADPAEERAYAILTAVADPAAAKKRLDEIRSERRAAETARGEAAQSAAKAAADAKKAQADREAIERIKSQNEAILAETQRQNDAVAQQIAKDKADLEAAIRKHVAKVDESKAWLAHQKRDIETRAAALATAEKRVAEHEATLKADIARVNAIKAAVNVQLT